MKYIKPNQTIIFFSLFIIYYWGFGVWDFGVLGLKKGSHDLNINFVT